MNPICRNIVFAAAIVLILVTLPSKSPADIYRWEDEGGGIHFTDDPSGIPAKYRGQAKDILKAPPVSGKPGLSTIGTSGTPTPPGTAPETPPQGEIAPTSPSIPRESLASQAEQLRAKIAAKEQFIGAIDTKRSNILNPMGNRFVSPEDLELYKKYSEELPKDRERLREVESRLPEGIN